MNALKLFAILSLLAVACGSEEKRALQTQGTSDSQTPPAATAKVLARVNGVAIMENDVVAQHKIEFLQIDRDYQQKHHQILENAVNQRIDDQLLTAEASAKGVSKDQLLATIHPLSITDVDVNNFYEQNKSRIGGSKEQAVPQIRAYLQQQNEAVARQAFFQELRGRYKVEFLLEPIRTEVAASGPAKGVPGAPVTIVEFSDFECPYCSRLIPTLEQVLQKYGNQVRLVFRQFPLTIHRDAPKAAEAALCANEQGKFWEMHDAMFHDQQGLAVDGLKAKAVLLGLNAIQFNQCLDSGKFASAVKADIEAGESVGVNSTPALFINGRFVLGAVPIEQITTVIDDELQRKGAAKPTQ
jgi:protein-disulfide isomerase